MSESVHRASWIAPSLVVLSSGSHADSGVAKTFAEACITASAPSGPV